LAELFQSNGEDLHDYCLPPPVDETKYIALSSYIPKSASVVCVCV